MSSITLPRVSTNPPPLKTFVYVNSLPGLYSLTTLIVGATTAVLIDPPQTTADAEGILKWVKETTLNPITAIFSSHHHPDHYWSADVILKEYPAAKFYATPHTCAEIRKDIEEKKAFVGAWYGDDILADPRLPEPYAFTFFVLPGNPSEPVMLLGPLQGDTVNCTMFWLPGEGTVITGDIVFGRNTHVWCEEVESSRNHAAWLNVLTLIENLKPKKLILGHIAQGLQVDIEADLGHTREYLEYYKGTIMDRPSKMARAEIIKTFEDRYHPRCEHNNSGFLLNGMANRDGSDAGPGQMKGTALEHMELMEHQRYHKAGEKTTAELEGWIV